MAAIFKSKWFWSLLGVICLSVVIGVSLRYFIIIGEKPLVESLWLIWLWALIPFFIWLLLFTISRLRARRKNRAMMKSLQEDAESEDERRGNEEVEILQERFERALRTLAGDKKRYDDQYLYEMPWYVIIGPPGSGKTTILKNSELRFPLSEEFGPDAIKGVGGTRHCDWWFTEDAILLDTAGRYVTQDSNERADRKAWEGFLQLLKQHRTRRPLNGILVVVSVTDIMAEAEDEREYHIRRIKQRLKELDDNLNARIPIYVLFTKCDLIAGFIESFEALNKTDRGQVWGMTFQLDAEGNPLARFEEEFDLLMQRLQEQALQRVHNERNLDRRALVYSFPQQIEDLKFALSDFLSGVFRSGRFHKTPFVRGVYFTSGTQEGTPLDRIIGLTAATFGLDKQSLSPHRGAGRSYFVTELFKEVIFREADLAGLNKRYERLQMLKQYGTLAVVSLTVLLTGAAWWNSYRHNNQFLAKLDDQVAAYHAQAETLAQDIEKPDFKGILKPLDTLRTAAGTYSAHRPPQMPLAPVIAAELSPPLGMQWGLYQGKTADPNAQRAYLKLLNSLLVRHVARYLLDTLTSNETQPEWLLYNRLKAYLLLKDPYQDKLLQVENAAFLSDWMAYEWQDYADGLLPAEIKRLTEHMNTWAVNVDAVLLPLAANEIDDAEMIADARKYLARTPLYQRVYIQIQTVAKDAALPDFSLEQNVGLEATNLFVSSDNKTLEQGIPGLYTHYGYCHFFKDKSSQMIADSMKENWVLHYQSGDASLLNQTLADKDKRKTLEREVRQKYAEEYINAWSAFINDIKIIPFSGTGVEDRLSDAYDKLTLVADSVQLSPLRKLLDELADNAILECESLTDPETLEKGSKLAQAMGGKAASINAKIRRFGRVAKSGKDKDADPIERIQYEFVALLELVEEEADGKEGRLSAMLRTLQKIRDDYVYSALNKSSFALPNKNQIDTLVKDTEKTPPPVSKWVRTLAHNTKNVLSKNKAADLNGEWTSRVVSAYDRQLKGKYPLARSAQMASLSDFAGFFGPDGTLDRFFNNHLADYVDPHKGVWKKRSDYDLADSLPALFKSAYLIRAAFVKGDKVAIRFELVPSTNSTVPSSTFIIGGTRLDYEVGPQTRGQHFEWPGSTRNVALRLKMPDGRIQSLQKRGEWAILKFFDSYGGVGGSGTDYRATVRHEGQTMIYQLLADSEDNAFNPAMREALEDFAKRFPNQLSR